MSEFHNQQDLSTQWIEEPKGTLAAEARELATSHPTMILAPDSSEAARFLEFVGKANDPAMRGKRIVVLVPRETALKVLRENNPQTLDWLEPRNQRDRTASFRLWL